MTKWPNESIFYHIYPLGLCGAPAENDFDDASRVNRIQKVTKWILHLKDLGVNAIYFGPLFESSVHGYDTADYYWIDRRLGSNEDFKEVAEKLHEAGIRIVLDGVFNHVGRDFWAFKDVQANGQHSKYIGWFQNLNFGGRSPYGDEFWYEGWEGHYNLVKLNLKNPDVINHILEAVEEWIKTYDIDGLRLDVAYCLDPDFLKMLRSFCDTKKQDFWLLGEMIHGDYTRIANDTMLHSATNYEGYKSIYSSHNDKNYFEIAYSLNRMFGNGGIYKDLCLYNFVDNHDVNRIASTLKEKAHLYNIYTLLFAMPGIPSIYYGSEWGIEGMKQNGSDAGLRPSLAIDELSDVEGTALAKHIQRLGNIRKQSPALKYGLYEQVLVKNEQLVFKRTFEEENIITVLNLSHQKSTLTFKVPFNNSMRNLLEEGKSYEAEGGQLTVQVPAYSGMILTEKK